jgi:osmotically-inducible protein OsmY
MAKTMKPRSGYDIQSDVQDELQWAAHVKANDIEVRLHSSAERTDSDLALAIMHALKWDAVIPYGLVDVTASHGFVTLKGTVDWDFQRVSVQKVVQGLAGVKRISNLIKVASDHPTHADIKRRIERALIRNAEVDAHTITVTVVGNTATLRGTVHSYAETVAATRTAWLAPGVARVENLIEITCDE